MKFEQRDAIREGCKRAKRNCPKCGSASISVHDGSEVEGLAGIDYRVCNGCGWSQAITKRTRAERLA